VNNNVRRDGARSAAGKSKGFGGHEIGREVAAKTKGPVASLFTAINMLLKLVIPKHWGLHAEDGKGYGFVLLSSETRDLIQKSTK
jgi:hypothetical protein